MRNGGKMIEDYLSRRDWRMKENANTTFSLQDLNYHVSGKIAEDYWLQKIYSKKVSKAHLEGDYHIHNLSLLGTYCVGWDLRDVLLEGFKGVSGKIESKPPKHFSSALGQVVNFFYTLQGESAGAQAFSNLDTLLAPFIRNDKLSYEKVRQTMQEFLYNMNVPTRVGFQTPFTNVTLDLTVPRFLEKEKTIIGGKATKNEYGDYQEEVDMFNRAFAEVMIEGDAVQRVFTFPIPTYNITGDFDWDAPSIPPVFEMSAKYGIPYFSNFISSDMKPEEVRSMCCRLRLHTQELKKKGGSYFGANPLTGSIGVVTLNLPRIGYLANTEKNFFQRLDTLLDLAKQSLETKRKTLEKLTEKGLYPYTKFYLRSVKEAYGGWWENHFSTIGVLGMNEAVLNLSGTGIAEKEGKKFAEKTLDHIRAKLLEYQKETQNIYNLEATPAEGATFRLSRIDKQKHPKIICANEKEYKKGAAPYYTNSTWLPVYQTSDLFEALKHQDSLQTKYTGGTVFHAFLGERLSRWETARTLVKKIFENFKLPYLTITPTFSICPKHGYVAGEHEKCPTCGNNCEVYSRISGYLRPLSNWNDAKRAEYGQRKTYDAHEDTLQF